MRAVGCNGRTAADRLIIWNRPQPIRSESQFDSLASAANRNKTAAEMELRTIALRLLGEGTDKVRAFDYEIRRIELHSARAPISEQLDRANLIYDAFRVCRAEESSNAICNDQGARSRVQTLRAFKDTNFAPCASDEQSREQAGGGRAYDPDTLINGAGELQIFRIDQLNLSRASPPSAGVYPSGSYGEKC